MNIGIDIDDTLTQSIEKTEEYAKKYTENILKREFKIDQLEVNFDFMKRYGWTIEEDEEFLNLYYKKLLQNAKPKGNAEKIINILHKTNKLYLITARADNVKEITLKWLEKNNIEYDKIFFNQTNKLDIAKKLELDIFIDDSINNCKNVASIGVKTFVMNSIFNSNENIGNIKRVFNWNEILELLEEKQ